MSNDTLDTPEEPDKAAAKKEDSWVETLQKVGRVLATVAGLCYLAGFLITNIYLASLGVVAFDILKAKYILSGFVFLSFMGILIATLYWLWRILHRYPKPVFASTLFESLLYSIGVYGLLYLFLSVLTQLEVDPAESHSLSSTISTTSALYTPELLQWLGNLGLLILVLLILIIITYIVAIVLSAASFIVVNISLVFYYIFKVVKGLVNKASSQVHMQWWNPYGASGSFWQDWKLHRKLAVSYFSVTTILVILFNGLVSIIEDSFIIVGAPDIKLSPGWTNLFQAVLLIYGSAALLFLLSFRLWGSENANVEQGTDKAGGLAGTSASSAGKSGISGISHWPARYAGWVILSILIFIVAAPVYALGIYDQLPQQFGGGAPIPVAYVATSKPETSYKSEGNTKLLLIDRSSDGSIFLRVELTQTINIVEISSSELEAITFTSRPK